MTVNATTMRRAVPARVPPHVTRRTRSIIFIRGDFQVDGETVFSCASLWKILGQD